MGKYKECYLCELDFDCLECEVSEAPRAQDGPKEVERRGRFDDEGEREVKGEREKEEGKRKGRSRRGRGRKNRDLGMRGEEAAVRYLERRGYDILERNWKCFAGEADIIACDERALVFVEVKTRSGIERGFPAEAVGPEKRDRYEKIALAYLSDHAYVDTPIRFDVVSIVKVASNRACIRHHIGAFNAA